MPSGNLIMAGNPEAISCVYTVEENIAKVKPTVLCGHVFGEHVAKKAHRLEEGDTSDDEFLYCLTMTSETTEAVNRVTECKIYALMLINEKPIKFHIDCGATVIVLPAKYVNKEDILPTKQVLKMWNKTELNPEGTCSVTIRNPRNRRKYSVKFIVVEEDITPLLRPNVIQQMALIEVHKGNFFFCVNMNFIQTEVNIVNRFSRFLIDHFQQSIKS